MLLAHLDAQGDLTSVNGYAAPGVDISVTPRLSAGQAAARAVRAVRADPPSHNGGRADTTGLRAAATDLVVYRTGATRGVAGDNVLTYVVEVTNRSNIRDMVFVDANAGKLLNRYSMMDDALERDTSSSSSSRPPRRSGPRATPSPAPSTWTSRTSCSARASPTGSSRTRSAATPTTAPARPMNTVNNDPTHRLPQRELERHDHQLLQRRHLRRRRRPRVGPRLHRVHPRPDLPVAVRCPQRVLLRHLGRDRRPDQRPHGRRRGRHHAKRTGGPVLHVHPRRRPLDINSPASVAGPCNAAPAAFGPVFDQTGVTDDVVVGQDARDPGATATDGCTALSNAAAVAGKFVYVDRGTLHLPDQGETTPTAAGAEGIVVGDNVGGGAPISMSGTSRHLRPDGHPRGRREDQGRGRPSTPPSGTAAPPPGQLLPVADRARTPPRSVVRSATCGRPPATATRARCRTRSTSAHTDDSGGVHSNSGVPNHAFALTRRRRHVQRRRPSPASVSTRPRRCTSGR